MTGSPPAPPTASPENEPPEPAPASTAASCDPPYWFDSNGNKRYYRHCVGR